MDFFAPNPWGLYDMHGNLYQWCEDAYGPYKEEDVTDPLAQGSAAEPRVLRGGSWFGGPWHCRAADRDWIAPDHRSEHCGCRVVLCLD